MSWDQGGAYNSYLQNVRANVRQKHPAKPKSPFEASFGSQHARNTALPEEFKTFTGSHWVNKHGGIPKAAFNPQTGTVYKALQTPDFTTTNGVMQRLPNQGPQPFPQVNWFNPDTQKRITLPFGDDLPSPWLNQGLVE